MIEGKGACLLFLMFAVLCAGFSIGAAGWSFSASLGGACIGMISACSSLLAFKWSDRE